MISKRYDVALVGGGIVGLATAMALTRGSKNSIVVLEAEGDVALHQTGHNSGVIHSGLYYRPNSSKALQCVRGRRAMLEFCSKHTIPHQQCGKVVVAVEHDEIPRLRELERRGIANGLHGLQWLCSGKLRDHEPYVAGVAGLLVPETGIVDYGEVARKFAEIVRSANGTIHAGAKVVGFQRRSDELVLETRAGTIHCGSLINCAGLQSDRIARMCGMAPEVKIVPFRGEYYKLRPEREHLVRNLIYPVPDPSFPFLGVHFTRMMRGGVEAGPNAVLALKREGYTRTSCSLRDLTETVFYTGFWALVAKYWKTGVMEMVRSFSKRAFTHSLQRLLPAIRSGDLEPGGAGVRAQALTRSGSLVDDFYIVQGERMIHVLNAPSPAATASISIGEGIAEMAQRSFGLARVHRNAAKP